MTKERAQALVEIFADADKRAGMTGDDLKACPDIEEILEAIHGC